MLETPKMPVYFQNKNPDPLIAILREDTKDQYLREGFILTHLNYDHEVERYYKIEKYPVFHHDQWMIDSYTKQLSEDQLNTAQRDHFEKQLENYKKIPAHIKTLYHMEAWRRVWERQFSDFDEDLKQKFMTERPFEGYYEPILGPYGVVDTPDQLLELYDLEADSRRFFVRFTEIRRDEQPDWGGWRWHKWGEYLGRQTPRHEYLYNETDIESVFVYHIYQY